MGLFDDTLGPAPQIKDPRNPRGQGLYQGQGGQQVQLELEGVDPSRLQQAAQQTRGSEFGTGGCESGSIPVIDASNGTQVGCVGYGSWGGMDDAIQIERDGKFVNLDDIPEGLKFGVLLAGFLRGLEYGSDEYNEASQTGAEWQALLRRYNAGDAGLSDLRDFDGSGLEGWGRWNEIYTGTINEESVLDIEVTFGENADIREILRRNGYDDETIDEIFSAEVNSTTGSGQFEGNNVLSNALCEIGYSNCSDWSVQPIDDDGPAIGSGCTDANQREGVIDENGDCQFTAGGQCMKGSVPGTTDASGECITDDGTDDGTGDYSEEEQSTAQAIKDWIEGQIGRVQDMTVDDVLDVIFGGNAWDPKCELTGDGEDLWDCTGTDGSEGNQCWKDCVSISVLGGIPGLPMPPGAVDIGTVRDLENTANEIGTTIGGILNPDENDEGFIEKVKNWVIGKIEDIFGDLDDVTLEDITGWITGTLGNVLGGLILIETENVTNTVTEKIDEILGLPLDTDDFDCSTVGREQVEGATTADDCGGCTQTADDGTQYEINLTTGACEDPTTEDPNLTQEEQDCNDKGRVYQNGECLETCQNSDYVVDPIDGECGPPDGTKTAQEICEDKGLTHDPSAPEADRDEDDCVDTGDGGGDGSTGTTNIDCEAPVSVSPYVTYGERLKDYRSACPDYCDDGSGTKPEQHVQNNCNLPLITETPECSEITDANADECGYKKCDDGTFVLKDEQCPITVDPCDPITDANADECGYKKCDNGTFVLKDEQCPITVDPCETIDATNADECGYKKCDDGTYILKDQECPITINPCENIDDSNADECGYKKCDDGTFVLKDEQCSIIQVECPEGTPKAGQMVNSLDDCGTTVTPTTCDDDTATNYGEEGPCSYGPDCNDCSCAEYAAKNPEECGTTPPPPEPPEGGGGGGRGMFRPQAVAPMGMGDPQLLARLEFPIVDYLSESLAKQTKDDLMSGMLTGNIV